MGLFSRKPKESDETPKEPTKKQGPDLTLNYSSDTVALETASTLQHQTLG